MTALSATNLLQSWLQVLAMKHLPKRLFRLQSSETRWIERSVKTCHRRRSSAWQFGRSGIEVLEDRALLTFSVVGSSLLSATGLRLVADFSQPVDAGTIQAADMVVDGSFPATGVNVIDADTVEFLLPTLSSGNHSATIAAGAIRNSLGTNIESFAKSFAIASDAQYSVKHNPRLQPGNAPLSGYAGSELDRVDVLWQTIPGGIGTQDSFAVEFRASGATTWRSAALNPVIETGVEGRIVWSASITGLNWNSDYEYRIRHEQADVVAAQYQHTFQTRLAQGDNSSFSFAAYGDSATGSASGFRQVQSRINQVDPRFAVLLGDNVYQNGSHPESDARFAPSVNPEAAEWTAGHIDYLGLGNHDVATLSGLPSEQNFSVPIPQAGITAPFAPPSSERPEHNYSWDYGNVHFVTFDTNSLTASARLDGLLNWVVADLNASTARWKIVYGHHPVAGTPDISVNPADNYYHQVVNRLKAAGVDLFMAGHSHAYSRTYPLTGQINGTATWTAHRPDDHFHAGEGLPQLVAGVGGVVIKAGDYGQFPFVAAGFSSSTPIPARLGFSKIDVTPESLTVSYIAADNGSVIDSFEVQKEATQAATFQQGAGDYLGTVDTFLHQNSPTSNKSTATSLRVDNDDPAGTGLSAQTLLQFNDIFGSSAGQIPVDATLRSATLQLNVTDGSKNSMNLHRMLTPWSAGDTWNSRTNGVQTDDVEAAAFPDTSSGASQPGTLSFNVLSSLQAWQQAPAANLGWVMMGAGPDRVDFHSSEGTVKPKLIVQWAQEMPNQPPVAIADSATTNEDVPVTIAILGNDTDPDFDALSIQSTTMPGWGTVTLNTDETISYMPNLNFSGSDSFSCTISDGKGGTGTAVVYVNVKPVNDAPIAGNDAASTTGAAPITVSVLSNDSDVDSTLLTVALASLPANGIAGVTANGSITYTANTGFWGNDSFTYRVSDGAMNSNAATVTVTVVSATKFFVVDSSADRTFRYQADGAYLSQAALASANSYSRGVASNADGSRLWVIDGNRVVYVYNASQTMLGSWTASGLTTPTGISVSGTDVWIVDADTDRVYRHAGAATRLSGTSTATSSFPLTSGNSYPQDLVTDGTTIWVTQSGSTDKIFVYQASNGASLGNWSLPAANTSPVGITLEPTMTSGSLWVLDNSTDRVYEYANARARRSGIQSAIVSFPLISGNGNAAGIADPVPASFAKGIGKTRSRLPEHDPRPAAIAAAGQSRPLGLRFAPRTESRERVHLRDPDASIKRRIATTPHPAAASKFGRTRGPQRSSFTRPETVGCDGELLDTCVEQEWAALDCLFADFGSSVPQLSPFR